MIINVCASSISREPVVYYSNYYYTEKTTAMSTKPEDQAKTTSFSKKETKPKLEKVEKKKVKIMEKLRSLIANKSK
uniref:Uncharacterized protein n=1 Tax=Heterorhabditis bacteriophora TaxID=37862 RepID=A0A1I7WQA1_HETBA